jgi:hypothetical protein
VDYATPKTAEERLKDLETKEAGFKSQLAGYEADLDRRLGGLR